MAKDESKFWELSSPDSTKALAEWDESVDLEQIICPTDPSHRRGGKRIGQLDVVLPNRPVTDIVWTWLSDCLIQDHVLELFKENNFTGFEVVPARARFKKSTGDTPPRLWELIVTGWAGMAPPESGIGLVQHCPACGMLRYSGAVDPSAIITERQWDGSDFFIVWPLPNFIFATQRVADFVRSEKLTGFALRNASALKFSGSGFGPGRLSYSMPEQRARELGEPLGIF